MPAKLSTHAREEGTYHITATFSDEDDNGIAPTTLTWTLSTRAGTIVNGRNQVSEASPATATTITLQGTDLSIISGETNERLFLIEYTYNSDYGTGLPDKEEVTFIIDDLKKAG